MTADAPGMDSQAWRRVDGAEDPGFFVGYLDRAAAGLRDARHEVMRALEVTPGCAVLDVGSGAGEFLIELAGSVQDVRTVGVDNSRELIRTATARADAAGVGVEFRFGDAEQLDFGDGSFDRVHCSRVLLHLEHPEAAVAEMARVLKPAGRLAIFEPDFDALMIDTDDLATSTVVRQRLVAGLRNPDIGRRLRRLVAEAGLEPIEVTGVARSLPSLQVAATQFHLFQHLEAAVAANDVSATAATAWRQGLEAADAAGRLFVSPVVFRVFAEKRT